MVQKNWSTVAEELKKQHLHLNCLQFLRIQYT